jgi:hypothetical protein
MSTDDYVGLATELGDQLARIDRNEWKKWTEYLARHGDLERALSLAQQLSQSSMLRDRPRNAYREICEVIRKHKLTLARLSPADLHQVLGFVGWRLVGRLGMPLEGALSMADSAKVRKGARQMLSGKRQRDR